MKPRILSILLLIALLLSAVSCTNAGSQAATTEGTKNIGTSEQSPTQAPTQAPTEEPTQAPTQETPKDPSDPQILDKSKTYNILFIGNSYTGRNNLATNSFSRIMENAGYKVTATSLTKGGQFLYNTADPDDELGSKVYAAFQSNKYDFVVIQEQSNCAITGPATFYTGVRRIVEMARANGATPILYETWGRKTGHKDLTDLFLTNETMTWGLAAGYQAIGSELGVDVAYAGLAFYDIYTKHPEIEIYDDDKTHPSDTGSYLAALTIFSTITGIDPTTVTYDNNLSSDKAALLKEAARKAVYETPAIPEQYKTSSVGAGVLYDCTVDYSQMSCLPSVPTGSSLVSILTGGTYPNGKTYSGVLGTKNAVASKEYSLTGLTDAQKADIADIGYGVSVIGIEKMLNTATGYESSIENMIDGKWTKDYLCNIAFDYKHYNINGQEDPNSLYTGLVTLNLGSLHRLDAFGFATSTINILPGIAEVFVSEDGVNWTRVSTACWDQLNGQALTNCGKSPTDLSTGTTSPTTCYFDMNGITAQYIRIGVVLGRNDKPDKLNNFNVRELFVYGEKLS